MKDRHQGSLSKSSAPDISMGTVVLALAVLGVGCTFVLDVPCPRSCPDSVDTDQPDDPDDTGDCVAADCSGRADCIVDEGTPSCECDVDDAPDGRQSGYECPESARYATNGEDLAFCLWEDLELPSAQDLKPYCHYLEDGYIGFTWNETPENEGYECPEGMRYAPNNTGQGYCLIEGLLPLPDGVEPYCHWLHDGYIGYHWPL